jgi:hypothetical protein
VLSAHQPVNTPVTRLIEEVEEVHLAIHDTDLVGVGQLLGQGIAVSQTLDPPEAFLLFNKTIRD